MKWNSLVGALVMGAGLCNPSYGFEWLDNLLGVDLDNSEAMESYPQYSAGYAPYQGGYSAPVTYGYSNYAPTYAPAPQASYGAVYQPVAAPNYQPAGSCNCGNQVTTMRPVVSYQTPAQAAQYRANQPTHVPATRYAPGDRYWTGN
jgi:hypothetical protein